MSKNKEIAQITLIVAIISLIGIFIPSIIGIDGIKGGFAISAICVFVFLTTLISSIVFWKMAIKEKQIIDGKNLIAHWKYTDEEWKKFTQVEFKVDASYKKMLFYIICGFAIFFGVLFYILDRENGIFVLYAMLALIALIALVALYSIWSAHQNNLKNKGEVFISREGVIVNRQFHSWKIFGAKLENVDYNQEANPKFVEFEYSTIARYGRQSNYVRVPVPKSEEKNVAKIIQEILS